MMCLRDFLIKEVQFHKDRTTNHHGNIDLKKGKIDAYNQLLGALDRVYIPMETEFIAKKASNGLTTQEVDFQVWFAVLCRELHFLHGWSAEAVILEAVTQAARWKDFYNQELTTLEAIKASF